MGKTTKKKRSGKPKIPVASLPEEFNRKHTKLVPESYLEKRLNDGTEIKFSFRFFDRHSEEAFNCGGADAGWFISLLDHLKSISELSVTEFRNDQRYRNHYRVHVHEWDKLKYKFNLPDWLFEKVESDCIQFSLGKGKGRVHGFVIFNTFYVVWLDPAHNLYPDERYGGEKIFAKPLTPYEELQQEVERLRQENRELQDLLEERTNPGPA